jgi:hypothetical protein
MADDESFDIAESGAQQVVPESDAPDELPIVARMVVEIRSDGTRTIARGALDDRLNGQQIAVELTPTSPWQMAKGIVKLLWNTPSAARSALRSALGRQSTPPRQLPDDDG